MEQRLQAAVGAAGGANIESGEDDPAGAVQLSVSYA